MILAVVLIFAGEKKKHFFALRTVQRILTKGTTSVTRKVFEKAKKTKFSSNRPTSSQKLVGVGKIY
jgi:hypothetical protein